MVYYSGGSVVLPEDDNMSTSGAALILMFGSIIFATIGMTVRIWFSDDKRGMFIVYCVDDLNILY